MKYVEICVFLVLISLFSGCSKENDPDQTYNGPITANHTTIKIAAVPAEWITTAREDLHIAFSHTSHGSQITDGMSGLTSFKGAGFSWNEGGTNDALDIDDYAIEGDLGSPDRSSWATGTRSYLAAHHDVNVVMWAWCGQVSSASEVDINTYLTLMSDLEKDFPAVKFVYMTGHLDGTGLTGNLNIRNEQIRNYCKNNNKILFDFADIESYNPDGVWFGDKKPNDGCGYDSNGDGSPDGNWAVEWQNSHVLGTDWYNCNASHSQPVNANMKAYAAWWLWARLAGWDGK